MKFDQTQIVKKLKKKNNEILNNKNIIDFIDNEIWNGIQKLKTNTVSQLKPSTQFNVQSVNKMFLGARLLFLSIGKHKCSKSMNFMPYSVQNFHIRYYHS